MKEEERRKGESKAVLARKREVHEFARTTRVYSEVDSQMCTQNWRVRKIRRRSPHGKVSGHTSRVCELRQHGVTGQLDAVNYRIIVSGD